MRAHRVDIRRDPRFNLAKHGHYAQVRSQFGSQLWTFGKIAYHDRQTDLYWVILQGGGAGGYRPQEMKLLDWEPEPWFTFGKRKGRSDLTAETQSIIINPVVTTTTPSDTGGDQMARRKAVEVEEEEYEDDLDDLDEPVEDDDEAPRRKAKGAKKGAASKAKKDEKPKGIGARQIAERLNVDGKTFRAWLRRQVAAGEIELNGRAEKERYDFGADWSSPMVQRIIKAWNDTSHEKGAGLKKAQEANAAKRAAKAGKASKSTKAPAKKAAAKKAVAKKSR